ncbi:MAG: glycoside hydrolase family 15, partial [Chloroflexi bacterium]|nr:glycoside hydrolase family 15 [Chloroflexota bacterium]
GLDATEELAGCATRHPEVARARDTLRARLLEPAGGAWTKWAGTPQVDASLLWMGAPYGLVDVDHPRLVATLARIEDELVGPDGGVYRYLEDTYYGGGQWLLLTAALGRARLRRGAPGDAAAATAALRWMSEQAGPDGSLPEQVATHALHPRRIQEWQMAWGESARPLLWSHATWLALHHELRARQGWGR